MRIRAREDLSERYRYLESPDKVIDGCSDARLILVLTSVADELNEDPTEVNMERLVRSQPPPRS